MKQQSQNNGYLIVASKEDVYYAWALNLIEQIKDYHPEAKVCFVTEERFCDGREKIADHIVFCDDNYRAKLWGMAQSPFDKTFYIDADMECLHEDIALVFDELGDNDMVFTDLREECYHIFRDIDFPGGKFTLCGGVCLYDSSNPLVMEFMQEWYDIYVQQRAGHWWPTDEEGNYDKETYPYHLRHWDQFTLWWLTEKVEKYKDLKIGVFEDNYRWNYWSLLHREVPMPENTVLYHKSYTATRNLSEITAIQVGDHFEGKP